MAFKETRVNRDITVGRVRLVNPDGDLLGIVSIADALTQAQSLSLDLVEVSPQADPPVCRILDYGKYRFESVKRKANKKVVGKKKGRQQTKEVKFRPTTDVGDYGVKLRMVKRFLEGQDKVKISVRFRGREMAHQHLGRELLLRLENDIQESGKVEQMPAMDGRQLIMVIAPLAQNDKK